MYGLKWFVAILVCVSCVLPTLSVSHISRSWHTGHTESRSPSEVMVDVINKLGLNILKMHNINNENNIALSPYGVASILTALLEGVRGQAALEIQKCGGFPADKDIIRVGLRDIHRLLRSYFIPQEGFLSGLSLSSEKVTLKPEYQSLLRFYGFDMTSFNTPIYPDIKTTTSITNSTEITTETSLTTEMTETTTTLEQEPKMDDEITTVTETTTLTATTPEETTMRATTTEETTMKATTEETTLKVTTTEEITTKETTTIPPTTETTTISLETESVPVETSETRVVPVTELPPTVPITSNTETTEIITSTEPISSTETTTLLTTETTTLEETTTESIETTTEETSRKRRSIIDYFIARYYDDQTDAYTPDVAPEQKPSFLVGGQFSEPHVHFMTYDVVLPFYYVSSLRSLALKFPLDSPKYYLLLILPVDEQGIDTLICDIGKTASLKEIVSQMRPTYVRAVIPSFMLRGFVILTSSLQKIGIREIFEPRRSDFSPMTDDKDIYVTNIEQAITVLIKNYMDPSMLNKRNLYQYGPVEFKATHPFLYFVMDSEIDVTLVSGKIVNPINSRIQ